MQRGETSAPGAGRKVLVADPEALKVWQRAAHAIQGGKTLEAVDAELYVSGVLGPRAGKLGHRSIKNFLTNPALVGELQYQEEPDPDGRRETLRIKAQ